VQIGQDPGGNPFPDTLFEGPRWLGVSVGSDPQMIPRQPLTSVPYALVAGESLGVWKDNGNGNHVYPSGEETNSDPNVWVCIGNQTPETLLHIYDFGTDSSGGEVHRPQLNIYQDGAGDASQTFRTQLSGGNRHHFTLGIDQHFSVSGEPDSFDFKICHETHEEVGGAVPETLGYLKGEAYNAAELMVRIHGTEWSQAGPDKASSGIVDFNHQSRARVYKTSAQSIQSFTWQAIVFDEATFDEHNEFGLSSSASTTRFTAKKTGYYQVNARCEFLLDGIQPSGMTSDFVSISIVHVNSTGTVSTVWAEGSKLQVINLSLYATAGENAVAFENNAPTVSDIVYLTKGESIEIHAFSTIDSLPLIAGGSKTYVSIHKAS
jgi:hypothetical protein